MSKKVRILWLLNHTTLRKFEVDQLNSLGVSEIFMPKSFPYDEGNLSANVDYSFDQTLSVRENELAVLNNQDWYSNPSEEAWEIANRYFDVAIIGFFPAQIRAAVRNFKGAIVLRVFGLSKGSSYSQLLYQAAGEGVVRDIKALGSRFWFGAGYSHLSECEPHYLADRNCFLPVGLKGNDSSSLWEGKLRKILFVCPRIGSSPYFHRIYCDFVETFSGLEYTVGGAQPVVVDDPNVIGFVSRDQHDFNMKQHRVMFYHSAEPNHIHYHPFEAIRAGMPLVFMAGGLLDRMGGKGLPGRCKTVKEARAKIERILKDDWGLIEQIRRSQAVLLEPMQAENCAQAWRNGFKRILAELDIIRAEQQQRQIRPKRIAIIVPVAYRGGSLRGAKLLAQALYQGSRQWNEAAEVVFLHLDDPESYPEEEFSDLFPGIQRRPFHWQTLKAAQARRAMRYSGHEGWEPDAGQYLAVDDGIKQLQDCDLWLVVSDRLTAPLLPLRPCIHMIYDYLQRYVPILPHGADYPVLDAARRAERVLVTTRFTQQDALQYAGLPENKVVKVPMLAPEFSEASTPRLPFASDYFVWTTNAAMHKNHENAIKALKRYYEDLDGQLDCLVTGVDTANLLKSTAPYLASVQFLVKGSKALQQRLRWQGELSDRDYQRTLARAAFLWHAGKIDNGTFSVIEAASLGVPALSSDYPAMREIDQQFALNLAWMDSGDPRAMAAQLKQMESTCQERRKTLPTKSQLAEQSVEKLAGEYWKAVRECL